MSQFAKSQSTYNRTNSSRHVAVRLVGNTNEQQARRPAVRQQRPNRRDRPSKLDFSAFLKAPTRVPKRDSEGFTTVKPTRRPRHRAQSPFLPNVKVNNANSFAALACDDSPSPTKQIALPKVVKPKAPTGVWGTKSAVVLENKPMKPHVAFANDSDTLMKPAAAETREYEKDSAPTEFVQMPDEEEYLKLKRSKSAWRPKSVPREEATTECARVFFDSDPMPTYIGAWADALEMEESDSEDDGIIDEDNMGRPVTDNSAW